MSWETRQWLSTAPYKEGDRVKVHLKNGWMFTGTIRGKTGSYTGDYATSTFEFFVRRDDTGRICQVTANQIERLHPAYGRSDYYLVCLDLDNTLALPASQVRPRRAGDPYVLLPGRREKLAEVRELGVQLAICTNQPGVAFGQQDPVELSRTIRALGAEIEASYCLWCFEHPDAPLEEWRSDTDRRKPGPGMVLHAMELAGVDAWHTLVVGWDEDQEAAERAGVRFQWAREFFGRGDQWGSKSTDTR